MTRRPAAGTLAEIGALRRAARYITGRAEASRRCAQADTKAGLLHEVVMAPGNRHEHNASPAALRSGVAASCSPRVPRPLSLASRCP